jgi:hypothetical protein
MKHPHVSPNPGRYKWPGFMRYVTIDQQIKNLSRALCLRDGFLSTRKLQAEEYEDTEVKNAIGFILRFKKETVLAVPSDRINRLITIESLRDVCLERLVQSQQLFPGSGSNYTNQPRALDNKDRPRCYCFRATEFPKMIV